MRKPRFTFSCLFLVLFVAMAAGAQTMRFVVTGDSRGSDNGINSAILSELVTAIIAEQADLVVFGGDLTNDGYQTQLQYWVQTFMDPLAAAGIPVYPCRGNHDHDEIAWNTVFSGDHALPANGPPGEVNLTYSVTYGNALFLMIEGMEINQAWVNEVLAANTKPHVFFCDHYPAFQADHADCLAVLPDMRDAFWDSIGNAGGRTYFTGHDHFYNHSLIEDSAGHWIHQYIAGTAGAPLYTWSRSYADSRVHWIADYKSYGYVLVEIDGTKVRLTFKQRVAPNQYEATPDVAAYDTAPPSQNLPAAGPAALMIMVTLLLVVFTVRRYATNPAR